MQIKNISKDETLIYKGIGILFIILHNFFHWMPPWTGENEFDFSSNRIFNFFNGIIESPLEFINLFFSYFGHYGVQIFIFISGVGLALSMQNKTVSWGKFMIERLKKLYPLLIVGFIFYFFFNILLYQKLLTSYDYREFLYKLFFIHTLLPKSGLSLTGPWWFFGLIFQLYVLFPLLFKVIKKYQIKAFILICIISYAWIYISQYIYRPEADILLLQNAPGHLPEFAFGILIALNSGKKIHNIWCILSLVIFSLGNFYKLFFPFTFLSATVFFYWGFSRMTSFVLNRTRILKKVLLYYGVISMALFIVHGPLRPPFIKVSGETFWGHFLGAMLFLICATATSILANMLYEWLVKKIRSISSKRKNKLLGE